MTATLQREPAEFWDKWSSTQATDVRPSPVELTRQPPPARRRRPLRAFLRFLITIGVGVGGTLAWQAYGDEARLMMATLYPEQLGWVAPQATTTGLATPGAPATLASAPPTAPSVDQQQLNALSLNLAAVRQGVEQLATQAAAAQQQMSGEIARLQASEQDILNKIAAPPPRPAPVAARKPPPPPVAIAAPQPLSPAVPAR
jgi:hypothetical protein